MTAKLMPFHSRVPRTLTDSAVRVLWVFACRASEEAGKVFISAARVASEGGLSKSSVYRAIRELERVGVVRRTGKYTRRFRGIPVLLLQLPDSDNCKDGAALQCSPVTTVSAGDTKATSDPLTVVTRETALTVLTHDNGKKRRRLTEKKKLEQKHVAAPPRSSAHADTLPPLLDTEAFRAQWHEWEAYRRERKLAVWKSRTIAAKLAELSTWGHDAAVASIKQSIANGWQGLFAPKTGAPPRPGLAMKPTTEMTDAF